MAKESVWTREKIEALAVFWQEKPILFNTKLHEYHDRNKRKAAISEIASNLDMDCKYVPRHTIQQILFEADTPQVLPHAFDSRSTLQHGCEGFNYRSSTTPSPTASHVSDSSGASATTYYTL